MGLILKCKIENEYKIRLETFFLFIISRIKIFRANYELIFSSLLNENSFRGKPPIQILLLYPKNDKIRRGIKFRRR